MLSTPVPVRHTEGSLRGFLKLSATDGTPLAAGDLSQDLAHEHVTSHLVFHFKDGSVHDETTVYSQQGDFRLLNYHLVQKGPSFHPAIDVSFGGHPSAITIHSTDKDGKEQVITDRMDLPPDVANGLLLTLLKNIQPGAPLTMLSMLATTPKPKLVRLAVTPQGKDPFSLAGMKQVATQYVVKVEIGGVEGALAKLLNKQPPDIHIWILGGETPAFVKMEGPLFYGGLIWRIELTSPVWPHP